LVNRYGKIVSYVREGSSGGVVEEETTTLEFSFFFSEVYEVIVGIFGSLVILRLSLLMDIWSLWLLREKSRNS